MQLPSILSDKLTRLRYRVMRGNGRYAVLTLGRLCPPLYRKLFVSQDIDFRELSLEEQVKTRGCPCGGALEPILYADGINADGINADGFDWWSQHHICRRCGKLSFFIGSQVPRDPQLFEKMRKGR